MKPKTKQLLGYGMVLVVFCAIALLYMWKPGISMQNEQEIDAKLKQQIGSALDPQARITYIHLDGFGASRKFRYAIISYLLPADDQSYTMSLYVDGTGGSFEPSAHARHDKTAYEDGLLLSEMDFSVVAANTRRIRDRFVEEGKEWMGVAEYSIRLDPETRDFVHETKVYYEVGPNLLKWIAEYYLGVAPNEFAVYSIPQNGTGELDRQAN